MGATEACQYRGLRIVERALRPEIAVSFSLGFLAASMLLLWLLPKESRFDAGMATLSGAFLGAVVSVLGALIVSKIDRIATQWKCRAALQRVGRGVLEWSEARTKEVLSENKHSETVINVVKLIDAQRLHADLYVLEGLTDITRLWDIEVFSAALDLGAVIRAGLQEYDHSALDATERILMEAEAHFRLTLIRDM
jgi:hypothetical protein